jgi:hypothetical protein
VGQAAQAAQVAQGLVSGPRSAPAAVPRIFLTITDSLIEKILLSKWLRMTGRSQLALGALL